MSSPLHVFMFDVNYAMATESVFTLISTEGGSNPTPPSGDIFLLLDGTDFLLLDGENLLLLGASTALAFNLLGNEPFALLDGTGFNLL